MKQFFLFLIILFHTNAMCQCLTDFQKLGPPEHINPFNHGFGNSLDMYGDFAVVGVPGSDSLQSNNGIAIVYQFKNEKWSKIATLHPSEPQPNMNFGQRVKIEKDRIYISSRTNSLTAPNTRGSIFVFNKPQEGWTDMTESAILTTAIDSPALSYDFNINTQETAIAAYNRNYLFIFSRDSSDWKNSSNPVIYNYADSSKRIAYVSLDSNIIAITTWYEDSQVEIKQAINYNWRTLEQLQTIKSVSEDYYSIGNQTILRNDILIAGTSSISTDSIFLFTSEDNWNTVSRKYSLTTKKAYKNYGNPEDHPYISYNDSIIIVGRNVNMNKGVLSFYKKPPSGWTNQLDDFSIEFPEVEFTQRGINASLSGNHLLVSDKYPETDSPDKELSFYKIKKDTIDFVNKHRFIEISTTGSDFGSEFALQGNILALKTFDNESEDIYQGSVLLYEKSQDSWELINTIRPETEKGGSMNFGTSIAFDNDYLVIGAPTYNEDSTRRHTGRVFVYKKNGDWKNATKVAELQPSNWKEASEETSGNWLNFGYNLIAKENTIIVAAPGKDDTTRSNKQDHGMIYIFEKDSLNEWTSGHETAKLNSSYSGGNARIGYAMDLKEDIIISSHNWNRKDNEGLISVFRKPKSGWKDTVENQILKIKHQSGHAGFRGQIKILDNLIFIGEAFYRSKGVIGTGRISVIKIVDETWENYKVISSIEYDNPDEWSLLGAHFDIYNNIMIVGSPFTTGRYYLGDERKGKAMIFQFLDNQWRDKIELLTLEGNKSTNVDAYGFGVDVTEDDFIIGAYSDDSETGFNSGAVYLTQMPPSIKLMDPVCLNDGPIELSAYPGGGVWSGNGIVDGTENLFYPSLAGEGIHLLTYSTPNCYYDGKIKITVTSTMKPEFNHDLSLNLCEYDSIKLEIDTISNISYDWYYQSDLNDESNLLEKDKINLFVKDTGRYWVQAKGPFCSLTSDTIQVNLLENTVSVDELPVVCDPHKLLPIKSSPQGGYWNSNAIDDESMLIPHMLQEGNNQLIYTYEILNTCEYKDTINIRYDPISEISYSIDKLKLCDGEEASITIDKQISATYYLEKWSGSRFEEIEDSFHEEFYISSGGEYRIKIEKHSCTLTSDKFIIDSKIDSIFIPNVVTPNGDNINDRFEIAINNSVRKELSIYDRWGQIIYQSNDYNETWPEDKVPAGIYYYVCNYNTDCNQSLSRANGWIQVLK